MTSAAEAATTQIATANATAGISGSRVTSTTPAPANSTAAHHSRSSAGRSAARFHGSTGPIAMATNTGTDSGSTVAFEERRANAQLDAEQQVAEQRIHRAGDHHGGDRAQQDVVQHQRTLARDHGEHAARGQCRRPQREQQQAAADHQAEQDQDEHAARRVDREGMHRVQNARAHQERSRQAQRERADRQQHGPDLQRLALLHHDRGMQQRGTGQPGQQRGILHRSQNQNPPQPSS